MADTVRNLVTLQGLLADNVGFDISPQDVRDFLISTYNWVNKTSGGVVYYNDDAVGIGTDTPTDFGAVETKLHLSGVRGGLVQEGSAGTGGKWITYIGGSGEYVIADTAANTRLNIDSSGNINALRANLSVPNGVLDVGGDNIRITTPQTPASNGAGTIGEIAWDTGYLYVCTATNTWERIILTGGY